MSSATVCNDQNPSAESCITDKFIAVIELRTDFKGKKFLVDKVGYPEESVMPRSDMRGTTVPSLVSGN